MNPWTKTSIELANQFNYLDLLYRVYPVIPEVCRDIDKSKWEKIENSFNMRDSMQLIENLLTLDLFPVKDSYVAYLRRDPKAAKRNPETVNRLAGRIFEMGLPELFEKCSVPKETNRQVGPLFKNWLKSGALGMTPVSLSEFLESKGNAICCDSDIKMMNFAKERLGYKRNKGLDFLGKFNGKYIIGEAKFLTDFGGHQNAQFEDALATLDSDCNAIKIAILDGVLYIPGNHKLFQSIIQRDSFIMSSLVLRNFLYQV